MLSCSGVFEGVRSRNGVCCVSGLALQRKALGHALALHHSSDFDIPLILKEFYFRLQHSIHAGKILPNSSNIHVKFQTLVNIKSIYSTPLYTAIGCFISAVKVGLLVLQLSKEWARQNTGNPTLAVDMSKENMAS